MVQSRVARFFFMHLGSFVAVIVYFVLFGRTGYSLPGVAATLPVALGVETAYIALAAWAGELKQFEAGIWTLFALGTLAAAIGVEPVLRLYQVYSPALLFLALGLTAVIPLVLGREPFTAYHMRRQLPRWQQRLPELGTLSRFMAGYWALLFFTCAGLCALHPTDPRFTFLYPNLLCFGVGMTAPFWLVPLYFKAFPLGTPRAIEPLLMGMPLFFDPRAAGDARASIQFRVSGTEAGSYHLRIGGGRCESFEGTAPAPDLTVHTPDIVWVRIAHGELDGSQAFAEGLYRVEGNLVLLTKLGEWFPTTTTRIRP